MPASPIACRSSLLLIALAAAAAPLGAQTLPPSAEPGRLERQPAPPAEPRRAAPPAVEDETTAPEPVPEGAETVRFVFQGVAIEGASALPQADIEAPFTPLIGQEVTLAQLYGAASDVTARYRAQGFALSRAVIPAQRIGEDGRETVRIVEGFVSKVTVEGATGSVSDPLARAILGRIEGERPLRVESLERALLLASDVPGLTARGVLRPDPAAQEGAELVVTLTRKPFEAYAEIDNRASEFYGPLRLLAGLGASDVLLPGSRFAVSGQTSLEGDEQRAVAAAYDQILGASGTRLGVFVSYSRAEPGDRLEPLAIEGDTTVYGLRASHPFIRSRALSVIADASFTVLDNETDSLGVLLTEDRVRWLELGGTVTSTDRFGGLNQARAGVSFGLDVFDATEDRDLFKTRDEGEASFTRFNAELVRIQSLGGPATLRVALAGQYSPDPLLASQEFAIGGEVYGRAYDLAEISGDSGLVGQLELGYALPVEGMLPNGGAQIYGYYEVGKVWQRDDVLAPGAKDDSLAAAGFGTRLNLNENFSINAEVAAPLTREVSAEGDDDLRFFFGLTARY